MVFFKAVSSVQAHLLSLTPSSLLVAAGKTFCWLWGGPNSVPHPSVTMAWVGSFFSFDLSLCVVPKMCEVIPTVPPPPALSHLVGKSWAHRGQKLVLCTCCHNLDT